MGCHGVGPGFDAKRPYGIFNRWPEADGCARHKSGAVGPSFVASTDGDDLAVEDIGVDLAPKVARGSPSRDSDLIEGDPELLDELRNGPQAEDDPFEKATDEMASGVSECKADKGPFGVGVDVGTSLTDEVG